MRHSHCRRVRLGRAVDRAAAPSEPMAFELRGRWGVWTGGFFKLWWSMAGVSERKRRVVVLPALPNESIFEIDSANYC